MYNKSIKNKKVKNNHLKIIHDSDVCKVSKASSEIMLHRFCNGNEIDFPFNNN